ncbi:MAG: GNAT family N-acetyltransferase [Nocardioidaceae bacterium]
MTVTDVAARQRFELEHDGELVGFIDYRLDDDSTVVMTHAEVFPRHGGQGFGSVMVRDALDAVRESGRSVVPRCSFVAAYIARHPEYEDLRATSQR